jgi:tetratricopeptide (TPR) repeat protein
MKALRQFFSLALLLGSVSALAGEVDCGSVERYGGGFGPFDYRDPANKKKNLKVVESFHFTPKVESLITGETGDFVGGDLSYVLQAFPNHHRALNALVRLSAKTKSAQPRGSKFSVDCWFDRAIRWRADDGTVRMLFANYLAQNNRFEDAQAQYQEAEKLLPDSPNVAYNFGLYYFDRKNYDKALEYAKRAYAKGFPLDGLKKKLTGVGKWN